MSKERTIKDVIQAMYDKYKLNPKITEVKLINAWAEITGPLISKHTTDIKLIKKTLYVKFDNAPLKNEMMYRRDSLIAAVNRQLGPDTIDKIFIQ